MKGRRERKKRGRERVEKVRPIYHGQIAQTGSGGALFHLAVRPWRPWDRRDHRKSCSLPCQGRAGPHTAGAQGATLSEKEAPRKAEGTEPRGTEGWEPVGGSGWVGLDPSPVSTQPPFLAWPEPPLPLTGLLPAVEALGCCKDHWTDGRWHNVRWACVLVPWTQPGFDSPSCSPVPPQLPVPTPLLSELPQPVTGLPASPSLPGCPPFPSGAWPLCLFWKQPCPLSLSLITAQGLFSWDRTLPAPCQH